jgi:hypothetical protein
MKNNQYQKTVLILLWVIAILELAQFFGVNLQSLFGILHWN